MQYISSFVAQKGAMVSSAESRKDEKFVKVSALISYLDMPKPVPIQILCRLSSLNVKMAPEFMAPFFVWSGMYLLKTAPSKRHGPPPLPPTHRNPLASLNMVWVEPRGNPSSIAQ